MTFLRILFVVDGYYPSLGGAERQVEELSEAFLKSGHIVKIIAPHLDENKPTTEVIRSVPVERIKYPKIKGIGALILCIKYAYKLLRHRDQYDAVHIHMVKNLAAVSGFIKPFIRASVGAKISGAWEFDGGILDKNVQNKILYRLLNFYIKKLDYIQCISLYTKEKLIESGYKIDKILMIPNGVNISQFKKVKYVNKDIRGSVVVTFAGRMNPVKSLDTLILSWSKIVEECRTYNPKLQLVGDGPIKTSLIDMTKRLGLSETVQFIGEVSNVAELMQSSNIYVQPSYIEGLPNSVIEAMATGLPVVATRISGNEDLVVDGENGILIKPGSTHELTFALCKLIKNGQLRRDMGDKSRQMVEEKYQIPVVLRSLEKAYRLEIENHKSYQEKFCE
jgi:glycosyltransferase involved in cell wall biosynthesis